MSRIDQVLLGVCALALAAVGWKLMPRTIARPPRTLAPNEWTSITSDVTPVDGATGKDTLVIYTSYTCAACRALDSYMPRLTAALTKRIVIGYRHVARDDLSRAAALAAQCANLQGRFSAYHTRLFASQDTLEAVSFDTLARQSGADVARFHRCLSDEITRAKVLLDTESATALGFDATPTLVLNGVVHVGTPGNFDDFMHMFR